MLSAADVAGMQATQEEWMPDACRVQTPATGATGVGQVRTAWSDGPEIPCCFAPVRADTTSAGMGQAVRFDATVRLRIEDGQAVTATQRIQLTRRMGVALAQPEVYEVLGGPKVGVTAVVLELRRVTQ